MTASAAFELPGIEAGLSSPDTAKGKLQRAALAVLREHEANDELPTSVRFIFYELEQAGVVSKEKTGARRPDQNVTDAVMALREAGLIPWDWIVDNTRTLHAWRFAPSVAEFVADVVPIARIDL